MRANFLQSLCVSLKCSSLKFGPDARSFKLKTFARRRHFLQTSDSNIKPSGLQSAKNARDGSAYQTEAG